MSPIITDFNQFGNAQSPTDGRDYRRGLTAKLGSHAVAAGVGVQPRPPTAFRFGVEDRCADFVAAYPEIQEICDQVGLHEHETLDQWSPFAGDLLVDLARAADTPAPIPVQDWSRATIAELIEQLAAVHHRRLRNELNRLRVLIVHNAKTNRHDDAQRLASSFEKLRSVVLPHISDDEDRLFPLCLHLEQASVVQPSSPHESDTVAMIRGMAAGHEEIGAATSDVLEVIANYFGSLADANFDHIRDGCLALRRDMQLHHALEYDLLMPAVLFSAEVLRTRPRAKAANYPA